MAQRLNDPDVEKITNGNSAVADLALYWNDPHQKPSVKWKKWGDLFAVAMTAKYSISVEEVLRTVTNEAVRNSYTEYSGPFKNEIQKFANGKCRN